MCLLWQLRPRRLPKEGEFVCLLLRFNTLDTWFLIYVRQNKSSLKCSHVCPEHFQTLPGTQNILHSLCGSLTASQFRVGNSFLPDLQGLLGLLCAGASSAGAPRSEPGFSSTRNSCDPQDLPCHSREPALDVQSWGLAY